MHNLSQYLSTLLTPKYLVLYINSLSTYYNKTQKYDTKTKNTRCPENTTQFNKPSCDAGAFWLPILLLIDEEIKRLTA